jgi:hypothetical protein
LRRCSETNRTIMHHNTFKVDLMKEIQLKNIVQVEAVIIGPIPSLGWLLTNLLLEEGDLPKRKPAKALHNPEL